MNDFEKILNLNSIGFADMLNRLEDSRYNNTGDNYPPYDIIKDGSEIRIELAVAGFKENEIEIKYEDCNLIISGSKKPEEKCECEYIHKGIAYRSFERKFTLSETIVVTGAKFIDGILNVYMYNELPEHRKPRTIEIGKSLPKKSKKELLNG